MPDVDGESTAVAVPTDINVYCVLMSLEETARRDYKDIKHTGSDSSWWWWSVSTKVFYIMLFLPRLFTLIIHSGFDYKCVIFEKASILNCTQEFLVHRPEHWIVFWLVNSIVSSVVLIFILWLNQKQLNYSFASLKGLCRKGSFWSLNFLYLITFVYYTIRIDGTAEISMTMSILLLFSPPVTLLVVYCLNYLRPVKFPCRSRRNVDTVCTFLMYWLTLVIYCAENACLVLTAMLDAVLEVAPLIEGKYQEEEDVELNGFVLILLGINVAFKTRLLAFFWDKIFHGNKDLLSEPSIKLDCKDRPCRRHTM